MLVLDGSGFESQQGKEISSPKCSKPVLDLLLNKCGTTFPKINPSALEADQSSSSAKVKNEWSFTSTPSVYLHGVDR